jgi:hypothetical protein
MLRYGGHPCAVATRALTLGAGAAPSPQPKPQDPSRRRQRCTRTVAAKIRKAAPKLPLPKPGQALCFSLSLIAQEVS